MVPTIKGETRSPSGDSPSLSLVPMTRPGFTPPPAALSLQRQVLCHWFVDDARWLSLSFFSGSVSARAFSSSVQRRAFLQSVALSNALLSHQTARLSFSIAVFRSGPKFGAQNCGHFWCRKFGTKWLTLRCPGVLFSAAKMRPESGLKIGARFGAKSCARCANSQSSSRDWIAVLLTAFEKWGPENGR